MPNRSIPDRKKAAIVALSSKYGYRAMAKEVDVSQSTVRSYVQKAQNGEIDMDGVEIRQ